MPDREKVIKGLHCCAHTDGTNCIYCPYDNTDEDCTALMSMDVLELLKEQSEIIRCKDCKHQREYRTGSCPYYTTYGLVPPDGWYCAGGVAKDINVSDKKGR